MKDNVNWLVSENIIMNTFKIKFNGMKLMVRLVDKNERINQYMLASKQLACCDEELEWMNQNVENLSYMHTACKGDMVHEHPRIYLEVLSPVYRSAVDKQDKSN